jgi:sulfur carrier protein
MQIIINGQTKEISQNTTLLQLIKELNLEGKVMAAAINMEIVKKDKWNETVLKEDDKIELLDFVGGG